MAQPKRTPLYPQHISHGANMVEFAGWSMPLNYKTGIIDEHLATRRHAGLFDVSHMGRLLFSGPRALQFLQHVLTNNVRALESQWTSAQYTILPTESGGAVDDAFLYHFKKGEYLLVVNASNLEKDKNFFNTYLPRFEGVEMEDLTDELAMISIQGPKSRSILEQILTDGELPEPFKNSASVIRVSDYDVMVSRTGYTGEPIGFELFVNSSRAASLWNMLVENGARPVGLGARDTLRLEASLPLYGHELGLDQEGNEIPVLALPQARIAVSFSEHKGDFVGREALERQWKTLQQIAREDFSNTDELPRQIRPLALLGKGVARQGAKVFKDNRHIGYVTSGTMVPAWVFDGEGLSSNITEKHFLRAIGLAYVDTELGDKEEVEVEIRGKMVQAMVVPYHLRSEAPPYARPVLPKPQTTATATRIPNKVETLLKKTIENTVWRQRQCINLIPSEMTPSPMVRLLTTMDPAFRYAEHRKLKAFEEMEVFYYQGTDFIAEVEQLVKEEMASYLGCTEVEARPISGQLANMAVFSGLVDYMNRFSRKADPRRIQMVLNNHINKGGHLSAQPMGALRDFVSWTRDWDRPAVVNFPVLKDNPYKIDLAATLELLDQHRPQLIVFGKSMFIHKEPVAEVCRFLAENGLDSVVMCDMAHVLGLMGPYFQEPFKEGADLITGSTHKTFFGTQRGIIATSWKPNEPRHELWEAIERRTFPGSVSNHHLGTLLGLLVATYEMNHFKDQYQPKVIENAKAFARALHDAHLDVAGDPELDFTETHQVILRVGYGRGPSVARKLEENNIICNYQACPDEEGFTVSGALRLGVAEMTRFGMEPSDFEVLAELMKAVISNGQDVKEEVKKLRSQFQELQFCFSGDEYAQIMEQLHNLIA
ncbi:MAG: glycine cleavage system aminomethyltransferase GcvT [Deltaproteobacteria bacterium]|nr:glycine cleavage system aminomethyltransferase GcvT [Deltaproteobacteria bacterium]